MEKLCTFCDKSPFLERIVTETAHHFVMPGVGQISDGGHVLLIPNQHVSCVGALEVPDVQELEELHRRMRSAITHVYGIPSISFEHGNMMQSVPHAHIHMLPADADLLPLIRRNLPDIEVRKIGSLLELRDIYREKCRYLLYENPCGEKFALLPDRVPSSSMRVLAAEVINPERRDWKKYRADPEHAWADDILIVETVRKLRAVFQAVPEGVV